MLIFIQLLSLFAVGATGGWLLEVVYRCLKHKRLINPGFLSGCALPIYGAGVLLLFIFRFTMIELESKPLENLIIFLGGAAVMTFVELAGGLIAEKYYHIHLWDYTEEKWNYKGLICPKFSVYWGLCCLLFCQIIYPRLVEMVENATDYGFILFTGFYYGIFFMDVIHSLDVLGMMKARAEELEQIIDVEKLKMRIKEQSILDKKNPFRIHLLQNTTVAEYLGSRREEMKTRTLLGKELGKEKLRELREFMERDDIFPKI